MTKINNRGGSEIKMTSFEENRDKRIYGREMTFDMTVTSRLPKELRVASSVITVLILLGIIMGLVVPGRTK